MMNEVNMTVTELDAMAMIRIKMNQNPGKTLRVECNSRTEAITLTKALRKDGKTVQTFRSVRHLMVTAIGRGQLVPSTTVTFFIKVS